MFPIFLYLSLLPEVCKPNFFTCHRRKHLYHRRKLLRLWHNRGHNPSPRFLCKRSLIVPKNLTRRLEMIARRVAEPPETISSNQNIVTQAADFHGRAQQLGSFLQNVPDALQLRDEFVYWNSLNQQLTSERNLLTSRAAELQNQIRQLDTEEIIWQATQQQIEDTTGIEAVAARVQQEIDAIRSARTQSQEQLNQILNMQNQMSRIA
jgi:potassium-dependent mechanosensitive channel